MPNVYSDTLTHDAVMVWLSPPSRDVVGGVQMRTAPPPAVEDTVSVAEGVTVRVGLALAVVDDTLATEEIALTLPLLPRVADVSVVGESVEGRVGVLLPAVSDDLAAGEAVTLALVLPGVSVADALTPSEAVELRAALVVVDEVTPDDAAIVALPTALAVADAVTPLEHVTIDLNVLVVQVADVATPTEAVTLVKPITLVVADSLAITERWFVSMNAPKKVKIRGRGAR